MKIILLLLTLTFSIGAFADTNDLPKAGDVFNVIRIDLKRKSPAGDENYLAAILVEGLLCPNQSFDAIFSRRNESGTSVNVEVVGIKLEETCLSPSRRSVAIEAKLDDTWVTYPLAIFVTAQNYNSPEDGIKPASNLFRYNHLTGKCEDSRGHSGLNSTSLSNLQASSNGECADLSFLKDVWGNGINSTYTGWNLKGAVFGHASALNVTLKSADFSGTNMESLQGGYSYFFAKVDQFTKLPDVSKAGHGLGDVDWSLGFPEIKASVCTPKDNSIVCGQL